MRGCRILSSSRFAELTPNCQSCSVLAFIHVSVPQQVLRFQYLQKEAGKCHHTREPLTCPRGLQYVADSGRPDSSMMRLVRSSVGGQEAEP